MTLSSLPTWLAYCLVFLAVVILGVIDGITGYELNFFVFYYIPIMFAAWRLGFMPALGTSLFSALMWFGADQFSGNTYSHPIYAVWNTMIRLASFILIGWAVQRIAEMMRREHQTNAELHRALSEIKVLEGLMPICAQCKKIRNTVGTWQQMETYITQHSNATFTHGYCPECAKKVLEDAGISD